MGVYRHNIVHRKAINPQAPQGDHEQALSYTYNDLGYPLTITSVDDGVENTSTLTYDCG